MCYEEGILQAYLDDELSVKQRSEIATHLEQCVKCRNVLKELQGNNVFVQQCMQNYLVDPPAEYTAGERKLLEKTSLFTGLRYKIMKQTERGLNIMKLYKKIAATAAMAAILFTAFSIPAVRSMAAEFLTVFRMEKVQTITINQKDIEQLEMAFEEGAGKVSVDNFGKIEVTGKQESVPVTLNQATKAIDFDLKLPRPAGYDDPELLKITGSTACLTLDVANVNSLLQAMGSTKLLPESLDGQTFTMHIPTAIAANYRSGDDVLMVIQARSPEIKVPSGVDVLAIRDALLNVPALPDHLRKQLLAVDDWQHTVLIPDMDGTSRDVVVNGNPGVFMDGSNRSDNSEHMTGMSYLVWQNNGVVYALSGTDLDENSALTLAGQMK